MQYSAELLKVKTTILNSNRTYKTKLSLKAIYNLSFRKCNGKSPSCPLSIGLDLVYWGGFYISFHQYQNMTFLPGKHTPLFENT